jgi:putative FmdB family regulatory protein
MPTYPYHCEACGKEFDEFRFMNEPAPEVCPYCGVRGRLRQIFHGGEVVGMVRGYENAKTFGQVAELNAKRMGKEQLDRMREEANQKSPFTGKLPDGARVNERKSEEVPIWRDGSLGNKPMSKPLDMKKVKNVEKYIHTGEMG